jgi:tetraacyldisaccharide 4'-kinase
LRRDLDLVLIDATCPYGFGYVLPRGLLREPLSALRAAEAIIITHADAIEPAELAELRGELVSLARGAPVYAAAHRPTTLIDHTGAVHEHSELAGKRVLAFCGLGNPQSFFNTLKGMGAVLAAAQAFPDHTLYGARELGELEKLSAKTKAEIVITTQKDAIKLPLGWLSRPLWKLAVEMEITAGREELLERIQNALKRT